MAIDLQSCGYQSQTIFAGEGDDTRKASELRREMAKKLAKSFPSMRDDIAGLAEILIGEACNNAFKHKTDGAEVKFEYSARERFFSLFLSNSSTSDPKIQERPESFSEGGYGCGMIKSIAQLLRNDGYRVSAQHYFEKARGSVVPGAGKVCFYFSIELPPPN